MDNSRVVSWRALRCQLNNMLIRYSVEEGIPFLNLSDVLAIAGIEAGNATSKIPDSFCRVVHGVMPADEPLRTITAQPKGGGLAVVASLLTQKAEQNTLSASCIAKHYGGVIGHGQYCYNA